MGATFKCPNGHTVGLVNGQPDCPECDMVATWWNERTGEAKDWRDREEYLDGVRAMNSAMDAAFDNQYFGEW